MLWLEATRLARTTASSNNYPGVKSEGIVVATSVVSIPAQSIFSCDNTLRAPSGIVDSCHLSKSPGHTLKRSSKAFRLTSMSS